MLVFPRGKANALSDLVLYQLNEGRIMLLSSDFKETFTVTILIKHEGIFYVETKFYSKINFWKTLITINSSRKFQLR